MTGRDVHLTVDIQHTEPATDGPVRVLVTNDDGIDAPGLRALVDVLADDYELVVVAPSQDVSGAGTGIGRIDPGSPPGLARRNDLGDIEAWAIDGPPGLAVMSAVLGAFGRRPDMVVSGINAGMNTGTSIVHSGTVGAAITARTFGISGVALSLAPGDQDHWHYDTAGPIARAAVDWVRCCAPLTTLNVNVPGVPPAEVAGSRWARIDSFGHFRVATRGEGGTVLNLDVHDEREPDDPDVDTAGVLAGWVTLTTLGVLGAYDAPDVSPERVAGLTSAY